MTGVQDESSPEGFIELFVRVLRNVERDRQELSLRTDVERDAGDIAALMETPLESCFGYLNDTITKDSPIDMITLQFIRGFVPAIEGRPIAPIVKSRVGPLSSLFGTKPDFYEGNYPFLNWTHDAYLNVRIFGNAEEHRKWERQRLKGGPRGGRVFATTLPALHLAQEAIRLRKDVENGAEALLARTPNDGFFKGSASRRHALMAAAKIVLLSTKHTEKLMDPLFIEEIKERDPSAVSQFHLPHLDQRNIVYIPVRVAGETIGGAALHSHYRLSSRAIKIIDVAIHHLLYRIRLSDEMISSRSYAKYKAQWDVTTSYVLRLAHDVRKPVARIKVVLGNLIARVRDRGGKLPGDGPQILQEVSEQVSTLNRLVSTRVGASIEELKEDARRDAHADSLERLVRQSVWLWEPDARSRKIRIRTSVQGQGTLVRVPRHLVIEVLGNLISNACEFAKSLVEVNAKISSTPSQTPNAARTVTFEVKDDGPGMAEQARATAMIGTLPELGAPAGIGLRLSEFIVRELLGSERGLVFDSTSVGVTASFTIPEVTE